LLCAFKPLHDTLTALTLVVRRQEQHLAFKKSHISNPKGPSLDNPT